MIDRRTFLAGVAAALFGGTLSPSQTAGLNDILDEWDARKLTDVRWLAYMLATDYWETDRAVLGVREAYYMGEPAAENYRRTLRYYPFYGRSPPQLTWEFNYLTMTVHLAPRFPGLDLVKNPDDALRPDVGMAILFEGMIFGLFTGVSLGTYFNATTDNPLDARRIINGTDHEADVADLHHGFLAALQGQPYYRLLKIGCNGDDVKLMQSALQAHGFYSNLIADGVYGAGTRMAVMGFQLSKGLDNDGAVGPDTRKALGL